ncbi:MAG: 4-(cytidine 5'-diphospho)-2-C-methyl-D-erythritol kinase, partial [Oscillospiraceae bacterium]|nr:4-(cytidine 5'-diphospho)-2-C-methyl-D-erythritol kinase [Oscillospiraceae bacterium]
ALVGSDVPYCVRGGTALAEGRGERLTALPAAPRFYAVLCKPDFDVSTPELFARVRVSELHDRPDTDGMLAALRGGDAVGVASRVGNVFEQVLQEDARIKVSAIERRLLALGADAAAMSGSGPTVFGLFRGEAAARTAYDALARDGARTFLTRFV